MARWLSRGGVWILLSGLVLTACQSKPLLRPNGVAVAADGSVYVMDRGNFRVVHLSADGRVAGEFGRMGVGAAEIYRGWGVEVGPEGNLYICNIIYAGEAEGVDSQDSVKVFTPAGQLVREIGKGVYADDQPARRPYGLDFDQAGRLYVADAGTGAVRVFDPLTGELLADFFGESGRAEGQFLDLTDIAVDDTRQRLYVSDSANGRIQMYDLLEQSETLTVTFRLTFGEYGHAPGQFAYPQGLAVDELTGYLYVADMGNRRIQVFDAQQQWVRQLAPPAGQVWQVLDVAVAETGAVYASDAYNNAVWFFEPEGELPRRLEIR